MYSTMWIHWILLVPTLVWMRKTKCDKCRHFITLKLQVVNFTYYWVRPNIFYIDEACHITLLHGHRHGDIRERPVSCCCRTLSRNADEGEESCSQTPNKTRSTPAWTGSDKRQVFTSVALLKHLLQEDKGGVQAHCPPPPLMGQLGSQSETGWRMVPLDLKAPAATALRVTVKEGLAKTTVHMPYIIHSTKSTGKLTYCLEILWNLEDFGSLLYLMLMHPGNVKRIREIYLSINP